MDVDVNWRAVADFLKKHPSLKAFGVVNGSYRLFSSIRLNFCCKLLLEGILIVI